MEAWLITWDEVPGITPIRIAGLLPTTTSAPEVAMFLNFLHAVTFSTLNEQASYIADPSHIPYKAQVEETAPAYHRIYCGHQPLLHARVVRKLIVDERPSTEGKIESMTWEERLASGAWESRSLTQRWSGRLPFENQKGG